MFQNQCRIPFTMTVEDDETEYAVSGMSMTEKQVQGLVGVEEDEIALQYRVTTTETSISDLETLVDRSGVTELRLPLSQIASAEIRGWWSRRIILQANDLELFEQVPGSRGVTLVLSVARKNRALADDLVASLQMQLSDIGMARLDERIRRLEEGQGGAEPLPPV